MKFKDKRISKERAVKNIIKVYSLKQVTQTSWYEEAHNFCISLSVETKLPLINVIGVVAALSPVKRWSENKRIARLLITKGERYHMLQFHNKALAILEASTIEEIEFILGGNKITSFFRNILFYKTSKDVTIDRHALHVIFGKVLAESYGIGITNNCYEFFKQCYVVAAKKVDLAPLELQAIVWETWRELKADKQLNLFDK